VNHHPADGAAEQEGLIMRIETAEDLQDFIDGCALLGVGGGGRAEEGHAALKAALEKGGPIEWIGADHVADDATAVCAFLMGSSAPVTEEKTRQMKEIGLTEVTCPVNLCNAVVEWERFTGTRADHVIPLEVGGANMPVPMAVARALGKPIIDGDFAGRAIPEIFQTTLALEDVPFCPGTSVDKFGNVVILRETVNLRVAERLGKWISGAAFGSTGMAGFRVTGRQLRRLLVRGTMSKALGLGRMLRRVRESGGGLRAEIERIGGVFLFAGRVARKEAGEVEGYYTGTTWLDGEGPSAHLTARVHFKNENHIVWVGDRCVASSPDLISCVDPVAVKPLRNSDIAEGAPLEICAFPCHPTLRDERIMRRLCPRHFGFDLEHVPIAPPGPPFWPEWPGPGGAR
jgi:DUF917 family protein